MIVLLILFACIVWTIQRHQNQDHSQTASQVIQGNGVAGVVLHTVQGHTTHLLGLTYGLMQLVMG